MCNTLQEELTHPHLYTYILYQSKSQFFVNERYHILFSIEALKESENYMNINEILLEFTRIINDRLHPEKMLHFSH